jgi:hypothetical protein
MNIAESYYSNANAQIFGRHGAEIERSVSCNYANWMLKALNWLETRFPALA